MSGQERRSDRSVDELVQSTVPARRRAQKQTPRLQVRLQPICQAVALAMMGVGSAHAAPTINLGHVGATTSRWALPGVTVPGVSNLGVSQPQVAQQTVANLGHIAAALSAQLAAQQAAAAAVAGTTSAVPNGLAKGGLQILSGGTWSNAAAPTQTVSGGKTTVTVQQTAPQALLDWQTFNVGRQTTLDFDQQGNASWTVMNRVNDPSAVPSQILGQIEAPGQVYVINHNGVIFGAGSQVNTGSLVASSALLDATAFTTSGIYSTQSSGVYNPSFTNAGGAIVVEPGAQISTNVPSAITAGGGYVLLMGSSVSNQGMITTPNGQTALAAGDDFLIRPGYSTSSNASSTTNGNEVAIQLNAGSTSGTVSNTGVIQASTGDITLVGHDVTQGGVALATTSVNTRGTIHLLNSASDTTGSVTLTPDSVTAITPDTSGATASASQQQSLITASAAQNAGRAANFNTQFDDLSQLPDLQDQSRVEIVSGGTVELQGSSLTMAQGGQIAVSATNRVQVDAGANLDVSGTQAVLPMSANNLSVSIEGAELADAPTNRDTNNLNSSNVTVDAQDLEYVAPGTGGDADARYYTQGGLLEVSGELGNVEQTINQWLAPGGTITLSTGASGAVVAQTGSNFNLSGGAVQYQAGNLAQSWLLGTDGRIYNINTAPASIQYVGVYNGFIESHPRWGVTIDWHNPLLAPSEIFEAGYTVGANAGELILSTPTTVFAGGIETGVETGQQQTKTAAQDPNPLAQDVAPQSATLALGQYTSQGLQSGYANSVSFGNGTAANPDTLSVSDVIPGDLVGTANFDASQINGYGLSGLSVASLGSITVSAPLTLNPGAQISFLAPDVDIAANVTARGGGLHIANLFEPNGEIDAVPTVLTDTDGMAQATLEPGVTIDTRGLWTNGRLDPNDPAALAYGMAYVNGGSVSIDMSQGVTLGAGSLIDVSSGGAITSTGGTVGGSGGNVSLTADDGSGGGATSAPLILGGQIQGYGVKGGGTLTIVSGQSIVFANQPLLSDGLLPAGQTAPVPVTLTEPLTIAAGQVLPLTADDGSAAGSVATVPETYEAGTVIPAGTAFSQAVAIGAPLALAPSLLNTGFSAYDISSNLGVSVMPGTVLNLIEPVYRFTPTSLSAPSGSDPAGAMQLWLPPLFEPNPRTAQLTQRGGASLSLKAGTGFSLNSSPASIAAGGSLDVGAGASITVDPGQSIALDAPGQITVDGALHAPGGNIAITSQLINDDSTLGQSIWIGGDAVLDAAGYAYTASDLQGRSYGTVGAGGAIVLGQAGDVFNSQTGLINSSYDFIVVQPGAVLDVSGTSAQIDPSAGTGPKLTGAARVDANGGPITAASNAGSITMSSYSGIYDDGTMQAAAGGAGALGGTLSVTLETPGYGSTDTTDNPAFVPRVITIDQAALAPQLTAGLAPGVNDPSLQFGQARFAADTLEADGFSNLSFTARDAVLFDGNVDLTAAQSIQFHEGAIAQTGTTGVVTIAAPYVLFSGQTGVNTAIIGEYPTLWGGTPPTAQQTTGTLTVDADLIDMANELSFGIDAPTNTGLAGNYDYATFGNIALNSQGDIRFVAGQTNTVSLQTSGNLALRAGQVYPATGVSAQVLAGAIEDANGSPGLSPTGVITISRVNGIDPALPDSVGGQLSLGAATVMQGGIVRAPLGSVTLGSEQFSTDFTGLVELLPGSITSISANGLDMPYGGTADGVTYTYNGTSLGTAFQTANTLATPTITINSEAVQVDAGATLDLSGGGELAGAGFVQGEGGSVDVLKTPLINANPANTYSAAGNGVYAIVPGYGSSYAPTGAGEGTLPSLGQQITIPAGVPGLPPGTYTLLPAYYALLPGGYRVELGKTVATHASTQSQATGGGSYVIDGYQSVANTSERNALPNQLIVTPGAAVLQDSDYDQQDYSGFVTQTAHTLGQQLPFLPADAGTLMLSYPTPDGSDPSALPALSFQGTALFQPAAGGTSGMAVVLSNSPNASVDIEITNGVATPGFVGYSISAPALDALHAPTLFIGGEYEPDAPTTPFEALDNSVTLRSGADLTAGQVLLLAQTGGITLESGATINTIGQGTVTSNTALDDIYSTENQGNNTLLAVSNDPNLTISDALPSSGAITIDAGAQIYSEGTIAFVTGGAVSVDPNAHYGTRNLELSVGTINIGTAQSMTGAVVPPGLLLTQDLLDSLFAGDTSIGAPALQTLTLTASQSVNFYGTVDLSVIDPATGKADLNLALDTPAIYGYGAAGDTATLTVGSLYWGGVSGSVNSSTGLPVNQPPALVTSGGPGTGAGVLDINAGQIAFGFPSNVVPENQTTFERVMDGFATVNLNASQQITSSGNNTLSVYQAVGADPTGPGTGGTLNLITPLLTGAPASVMTITAGDTLALLAPTGVAPSTQASGNLGAEIDLNAGTIDLASTILLPSGKLNATADGDIDLQPGARLTLTGQATTFVDQTEYSWGGNVNLQSTGGNITQAAGSVIDVSAVDNNAGSITVEAVGSGAGRVALNGTLLGAATLSSGATVDPLGGSITIGAQTLASGNAADLSTDFTTLNAALDAGGFTQARSFDLKQGDLTIGDGLQAHQISVSVDNGSLTVNGTIDASGSTPGSITLAAIDDLTLNGTLDAHGTVLQVDSYGNPIDAENQATVALTSTHGMLTLSPGATINVSSPEAAAQGDVELNVARTAETSGDANISATGTVTIKGAGTIALNAFWTYAPTDPYGTIVQDNGDTNGNPVAAGTGYVGMNQIDVRSQAFIDAAIAGGSPLLGRIGGLTAYTDTFHLRPGVEIDSATPNGTLTVAGDIDLSAFRYNSLNPNTQRSGVYGSGEPGALVIRAGGNLDVVGSISDGFAPAPASPDDSDWYLVAGQQNAATETLLPIVLESGTSFPNTAGLSLRYAIPINGATIAADAVIPTQVALSDGYTIPAGTRLTAPVYDASGNVLYAAGTTFTSSTSLPAGTQLGAGSVMPGTVDITAMNWPAGASLGVFTSAVSLSANATVPFEGIIPSGANLVLAGVDAATRPTGSSGTQGATDLLAPMLPAGDLSWSLRLVSGADLSAADTRIVKPASVLKQLGVSGNLTLSDGHQPTTIQQTYYYYFSNPYVTIKEGPYPGTGVGTYQCTYHLCTPGPEQVILGSPVPSVVRTGTGNLDLIAGGSFNETSLYGTYTAGTQSSDVGPNGNSNPYNLPRGTNSDGSGTVLGSSSNLGSNSAAEAAIQDYQAYYPTHGGNVTVSAQGNLSTDSVGASVSNWLWWQGGGSAVSQATAWWVNFGTYVDQNTFSASNLPAVTGFTGIGTLGGGNLTINVGGNAGTTANSQNTELDAAVASTGRVLANGTLEETGGGALNVNIGGDLNQFIPATQASTTSGSVTDLRGNIAIDAGAIGVIVPLYGAPAAGDPRAIAPTVAEQATSNGGVNVTLGDGTLDISTDGDLTVGNVNNATLGNQTNRAPFSADGTTYAMGGNTGFSLWTPATAVSLFSAGGNLTPSILQGGAFYPSTLNVTAASGNIYFQNRVLLSGVFVDMPIELTPSPSGELNLLAAGSIYGAYTEISGADPTVMSTPFNPAFNASEFDPSTGVQVTYTNVSPDTYGGQNSTNQLMAFGPDTPTSNLHASDTDPAHIYAGGDIVDMQFGNVLTFCNNPGCAPIDPITWYVGAKPADIVAAGDIIGSGVPYGAPVGSSVSGASTSAGFVLNNNPQDISTMTAGGNILYSSMQVAGPGLLLVSAGGNIYEGNQGAFQSVGQIYDFNPNDRSNGAGITVLAGVGSTGPNYAAFANDYLNPTAPDAQIEAGMSDYPSIVAQNDQQLVSWLQQNAGYTGSANDSAGAWAFFQTLSAQQQDIFLRQIFFAQLNAGGLEFNDPTSIHYKSYIAGQDAIAALFPTQNAQGEPISYSGDITMFGPSGIHTDFGGAIQTFTPGGQTIVGVQGTTPPGSAGVLTQGSGDIDMYSQGSILLGESRVMTTFGGGILMWSATGNINAGEGAKTTVVYQPPIRAYDAYGNVTLSPPEPSQGAGIATLDPIPGTPPGDQNLVAPQGTIDAGEAGIRVSGNLNVAALQVVNASNIQVQGKATGIPIVAAVNTGALTAADAATSAVTQIAQNLVRNNASGVAQRHWIITVQVEGFGDADDDGNRKKRKPEKVSYDPSSAISIVGFGPAGATQRAIMTKEEQSKLGKI